MSFGSCKQIRDLAAVVGVQLRTTTLTMPCRQCGRAGCELYCPVCDNHYGLPEGDDVRVTNLPCRWSAPSPGGEDLPRYAYESSPASLADPVDALRLGDLAEIDFDEVAIEHVAADLESRVRALVIGVRADEEIHQKRAVMAASTAAEQSLYNILDDVIGGPSFTEHTVIERLTSLCRRAASADAQHDSRLRDAKKGAS